MTSDLLARISAGNYAEVRQDSAHGVIFWRVRKLSPPEAAKASALEGLMSMAAEAGNKPKMGRMANTPDPTIAQAIGLTTMFDNIVKLAVVAVRGEGDPWQPVRLVDADAEDIEQGLLSVASIGHDCHQAIVTAAIQGATGAAGVVSSFRGEPTEPADPS